MRRLASCGARSDAVARGFGGRERDLAKSKLSSCGPGSDAVASAFLGRERDLATLRLASCGAGSDAVASGFVGRERDLAKSKLSSCGGSGIWRRASCLRAPLRLPLLQVVSWGAGSDAVASGFVGRERDLAKSKL
jgi:hypothetical protein